MVGKSAIVDVDGMAFGAFMAKYTSVFSGLLNQYILTFIESPVFRKQTENGKSQASCNQLLPWSLLARKNGNCRL